MCFCFLKHSHANCPCKVIVLVLPQSKSCSFRSTLHGMLVLGCSTHRFPMQCHVHWNVSFLLLPYNRPAITSCIVYLSKHKCSIPSDTCLYKDEVLTLVVKVTIIPIAVFAELFVSILTTRNHFGRRYGSRHRLWQHCLLQAVHVIGLWNILIVLQIFTMCAIPLYVLLLTHPQASFLCLSAMVMTLVGLTLIVAYLMYQCQTRVY